jgi:membrane protease YdiL (CAAX protease family)
MNQGGEVATERGPGGSPRRGASQVYVVAWFFYLGLAVAAAIWIGVRDGGVAPALFLDRSSWRLDLLLGLALAVALGLVWWLARAVLPAARRVDRLLAAALGPLRRGEVVALALLSGFAEELFFRGAVQGSWGPVWATVIFALLHGGPGRDYRLWTVFAALAGAALAALVAWRGNLLAAVVAHTAFNAFGLWRLATLPGDGEAASRTVGAVGSGGGDG